MLFGALSLMSFDDGNTNNTGTHELTGNPMFGSREECMPPIVSPYGEGCVRQCRTHTYIFWIDFVGNFSPENC
ncbi:MAG: hypothetical protein EAZ55_10535 [Cytophagales bacterium]|nr:MAG: hypothetical protein EAZ55_10535 [Cytophagales bacterium]